MANHVLRFLLLDVKAHGPNGHLELIVLLNRLVKLQSQEASGIASLWYSFSESYDKHLLTVLANGLEHDNLRMVASFVCNSGMCPCMWRRI